MVVRSDGIGFEAVDWRKLMYAALEMSFFFTKKIYTMVLFKDVRHFLFIHSKITLLFPLMFRGIQLQICSFLTKSNTLGTASLFKTTMSDKRVETLGSKIQFSAFWKHFLPFPPK